MDEEVWIPKADIASVTAERGIYLDIVLRGLKGTLCREQSLGLGFGGGTGIDYRADAIRELFKNGSLHFDPLPYGDARKRVEKFKKEYSIEESPES